jgi:hypothetical protein
MAFLAFFMALSSVGDAPRPDAPHNARLIILKSVSD